MSAFQSHACSCRPSARTGNRGDRTGRDASPSLLWRLRRSPYRRRLPCLRQSALRFHGSCHTEWHQRLARNLYAGGGIIAASQEDAEWLETESKTRVLASVFLGENGQEGEEGSAHQELGLISLGSAPSGHDDGQLVNSAGIKKYPPINHLSRKSNEKRITSHYNSHRSNNSCYSLAASSVKMEWRTHQGFQPFSDILKEVGIMGG